MSMVILLAMAGHGLAQNNANTVYRIDSGDKLRITVFGEKDLSGEFELDGRGTISMPLIGQVNIKNRTLAEAQSEIERMLLDGYLKRPRVSIEVENYRPFYILGEVKKPGNYPYVDGMVLLNAVAMAEGYTYRANKKEIIIIRANDPNKKERLANSTTIVLPGDIIRIKERFF